MQHVAAEMNLSETAFLRRSGDDAWSLRWFTPACEVDLCGHATLASAHALWESGAASEPLLRFATRSGILTAQRSGDWIELDFPAMPATPVDPPAEVLAALGITSPRYIGRNAFDYLIEADDVASLRPDLARLRGVDIRGVIVTARGNGEYDFVSRFFAPRFGIDEDPVTGSAHCCLAPYWSERLGRDELTGYQASPRGGVVRVRMAGDRVKLGGRAVTVLRGDLVA
jgi:predicted PhzF superfamily epimerase YddE/YHI9